MKKLFSILTLSVAFVLINSGCSSDETIADLSNTCHVTIIRELGTYHDLSDTIIYQNDKIIRIQGDNLGNLRLEYSNNTVNVYETINDVDLGELDYILILDNSKLSQIKNENGDLYCSYHYNGNKLEYALYHDLGYTSDSMVVKYDAEGNNIVEMKWYKINDDLITFRLIDTFYYVYDNKNNPFRYSLYYPLLLWDDEEYSFDYFNKNNILSIDSYTRSYSYNENNYPEYVDGRDSWRTYFTYNCN
jgi:hypothetical protein